MREVSDPNKEYSWDNLIRSINKAARILGFDLTETDMPQYPNWFAARKLHSNLWNLVYLKNKER